MVLETAVRALLEQSTVQTQGYAAALTLHTPPLPKTKEIPKQTNTKPREQPECGEMEVWGKKEMGERLKPNISTPD